MIENLELKLSSLVLILLAGVYIVYELLAMPSGSHPFGHGLGILGTVLMVMTETLYSARKRLGFFNVGRLRYWLSFHIFTGIVGPALVLMHTGLEFRGLAGFTMLLTVLVVASGFLGRYIYTAVPRTLAGVEVDRRTLQEALAREREALAAWSAHRSARVQTLVQQETAGAAAEQGLSLAQILTRRLHEWRDRRRLRAVMQQLQQEERTRAAEIRKMLARQQQLVRQIRSLQSARRLLGLWHMGHVPLGLLLFTSVIIHIVATIYYGALS
jgi:hypothetical protein